MIGADQDEYRHARGKPVSRRSAYGVSVAAVVLLAVTLLALARPH
ncbi:hypothetical protein [Kitasatospora sp. A2-31]|nr:hypothetical protein [Kitasatospora sp. A2-31]